MKPAAAMVVMLCACAAPADTARAPDSGGPATLEPAAASDAVEAPAATARAPQPARLRRQPIIWNLERERLTQAYLQHHHGGDFSGDPGEASHMVPRMIVVHWTAGPTAHSARNTFLQPQQQRSRRRAFWNLLNLSSHFIVDRGGEILQLMEPDRVGRHTIGLNHLAIGIENVGDRKNWPLTRSQVEANAALVRWLVEQHPTISHLIGHYEYRSFEGTSFFRDRTPFRTGRVDPGVPFMEALRHEVADLDLLGPPTDD